MKVIPPGRPSWEALRSIATLAWQARLEVVALPFQLGAELIRGTVVSRGDLNLFRRQRNEPPIVRP